MDGSKLRVGTGAGLTVAVVVGVWVALGLGPRRPTALGQEPGPLPASAPESETVAKYRHRAERSNRPEDWYNYGTALLADGRVAEAREPLRRAAAAEEERVEWFGQYNYGLARALTGHARGGSAPTRREELLAARAAFREVLRRTPDDEDARWNLELVDRWLRQPPQSGGGRSSGGGASPPTGGSGSGESSGGAQGGERRQMSPKEASAMLERAGRAESAVRNRILGRSRFRDPVVERNW